jgi:uroporphyrinogen decarboxylase
MTLSKIEGLKALGKGETLEPTPFAVWRHFPVEDLYADKLAKKQLDYQEKFDSIVMKVSPNGRYCVVDWGCEIAFDENKMSGSAYCTDYRIKTIDDWATLEELDVNQGMFGEQLQALKLINEGMKIPTPFVETVFNPLMVAAKLVETRDLFVQSMRENPKVFHDGMKTITKVMTEFSKASIENGAAGLFLATQEATTDLLTKEEYTEFGMNYDLTLLKTIEKKAEFNIVHIHGDNIMFDLIAENYKVQALNWHDQLATPTIDDAFKKFKGIVMGGIEEKQFLLEASNEELLSKIQEVIDSVNGRRLIIAPGCVIPINISDEKVQVIIDFLNK